MSKRPEEITTTYGKYSDWIFPAQGHLMECCTCCLCHNLTFGIFEAIALPNGQYKITRQIKNPNLHVGFRIKENVKATNAARDRGK